MGALLLRFNIKPNDLPTKSSAIKCQDDLTLSHADKCPFEGFVIRRHNYVKTVLAQQAEKAFGPCSVVVEPSLGVLEWDEKVKNILSSKFPSSKIRSWIEIRIILNLIHQRLIIG